jgi:hypothetical protein
LSLFDYGVLIFVSRFLNFAAVQPSKRPGVSLAGCPIPEPEGPYTREDITTSKWIEFSEETTTRKFNVFIILINNIDCLPLPK